MSLRLTVTFLLLALVFLVAAVIFWEMVGWPALLFAYSAFSFLLIALAYAGLGPGLFRKRADGRLPWLTLFLLGPYLLLNALSFRLYLLGSQEPAHAQADANLSFGRRLTSREARAEQARGWIGVLDLACEFTEVGPLRRLPHYRSLPVLDATAPDEEQLRWAVSWLKETVRLGPVYVHCALGHGRSVTVVLAYLLCTGKVRTLEEGLARLRCLRRGVKLHPGQARRLRSLERSAPAR